VYENGPVCRFDGRREGREGEGKARGNEVYRYGGFDLVECVEVEGEGEGKGMGSQKKRWYDPVMTRDFFFWGGWCVVWHEFVRMKMGRSDGVGWTRRYVLE
jgi:hypothetical protein